MKEVGKLGSIACLQAQGFPAAEITRAARARRATIMLLTFALLQQNTQ